MLSQATIKELQQILKEEYGRDVNLTDAATIAQELVGYYDLLAKIYHREKTENNNNNHDNQRLPNEE